MNYICLGSGLPGTQQQALWFEFGQQEVLTGDGEVGREGSGHSFPQRLSLCGATRAGRAL